MISIIVPIYKTEEYLRQCTDSVLAQTYTDWELILVDDGSPDNSAAVCDAYAQADGRIRVIHKKNGGLSDARNAGIEQAEGEWLLFLDSDDYLHPEMLAHLVEIQTRTGADIASCGFTSFIDGEEPARDDGEGEEFEFSAYSAVADMFSNKGIGWCAWGKLYRRELFVDLRYPTGMLCEDKALTYKAYLKAEKIVHTRRRLCFYRVRGSSIMGARSKKLCLDSLHVNEEICTTLANVDKGLYALAGGYAARCSFYYYTQSYNRADMSDVAQLSVEQLRKYYSYVRSCGYIAPYQRLLLLMAGRSVQKKDTSLFLKALAWLSGKIFK